MKPILTWTLWQRRASIVWWSLGVAFFVVLTLAFYASFRDQAAQLNQVLDRLPSAARSLFAGDNSSLLSPEGFLNARLYYLMLPLLLGILAIGLGSSLVAKEEDDGTLELLLARPVSRARLLAAKALAGFFIVAAVSLVALVTTLIVCRLVQLNEPVSRIILANFLCLLLSLLFGAIAFCLTTIGRARSWSIGLSVLIALGGYIIASLESTVHWLHQPAKILPYHYYRPNDILQGNFVWQNAVGFLAAIAALGFISWLAFRQRDLNG